MKLSKAGYGRPQEILNERADLVLAMLDYEGFLVDYETTFREINKDVR